MSYSPLDLSVSHQLSLTKRWMFTGTICLTRKNRFIGFFFIIEWCQLDLQSYFLLLCRMKSVLASKSQYTLEVLIIDKTALFGTTQKNFVLLLQTGLSSNYYYSYLYKRIIHNHIIFNTRRGKPFCFMVLPAFWPCTWETQ